MTYHLWAVIDKHTANLIEWRVATDSTPTHHKDERWVLVTTFKM